jgi:heme/copper-type cytochrome/quinol oxidase subunit 3
MDEPVPLQEAAASAPVAPGIEAEPPEWQARVAWVGARQLTGAAAFFFMSFLFAYFYLKSQDVAKKWTYGHVSPPVGWGVAIIVVLIVSAVLLWLTTRMPARAPELAFAALGLALVAVALQCIAYTRLGFGPASGVYASVYIGWTAFYAVFLLACAYWIEVQAASMWRRRREGAAWAADETVPEAAEAQMMGADLQACSFFWNFYVFFGFAAFVLLYLIGT